MVGAPAASIAPHVEATFLRQFPLLGLHPSSQGLKHLRHLLMLSRLMHQLPRHQVFRSRILQRAMAKAAELMLEDLERLVSSYHAVQNGLRTLSSLWKEIRDGGNKKLDNLHKKVFHDNLNMEGHGRLEGATVVTLLLPSRCCWSPPLQSAEARSLLGSSSSAWNGVTQGR